MSELVKEEVSSMSSQILKEYGEKTIINQKNPKVGSVVMWQQGDFTDAYGKSKTNTAIRISLEKSEADKVDWAGLKTRALMNYQDLFNVATLEYRHPAITKELQIYPIKTAFDERVVFYNDSLSYSSQCLLARRCS